MMMMSLKKGGKEFFGIDLVEIWLVKSTRANLIHSRKHFNWNARHALNVKHNDDDDDELQEVSIYWFFWELKRA